MVKNSDAVFIMLRQEIKMSSTWSFIYVIGLPNSIFELNDNVLNHESDGKISLNLHFIVNSQK